MHYGTRIAGELYAVHFARAEAPCAKGCGDMNTIVQSIISQEDRKRYEGQFVALDDWSQEGHHSARVIAAGETIGDLEDSLRLIGKEFRDVIVFFVSAAKTDCYTQKK